jgi:hypothetical protein
MNNASNHASHIADDLTLALGMNPSLSTEELNVIAQHKVEQRNNTPQADFFNLSPNQVSNWLYAPFNALMAVTMNTPTTLTTSPVMRYLTLIIEQAMQQGGSFKATTKGNLPAKLVTQATDLLPEFAVAKYNTEISISEFAGSNEDKFNALHYTRILAEIAGIIYLRSGRFHVKKTAQKQYQNQGIAAFFLPMLEAATTQYNWGYFDAFQNNVDLRTFWVFALWRLQSHCSIEQLTEDLITAFPDLLNQFESNYYSDPKQQLSNLIESRFINRFLVFWGFITVDPKRVNNGQPINIKSDIQPLLGQTFKFLI